MSEQQEDLTLETDHLEQVIETPPAVQPVVVIQYRSRGLPWYAVFPLLVLVPLAAVAVYHRATTRALPPQFPSASLKQVSALVDGNSPIEESEPGTATRSAQTGLEPGPIAKPSLPLALNSQPIAPEPPPSVPANQGKPEITRPAAAAAPTPAPSAPAKGESSGAPATAENVPPKPVPLVKNAESPEPKGQSGPPTRLATRKPAVIGFSAPIDEDNPFAELDIARTRPILPGSADADASPAVAMTLPTQEARNPTREELLESLQAESAEKKAELQQLRELKDHARDAIAAENMARTEDERIVFRRELSDLLKTGGKKSGKQIDELCDRFGRNYDDQLRARVTQMLARANGRTSREAKVRLLRLYGVPEPGILDFLANDLHRFINTRNGPRDPNDVRVNAASLLLRIKLVKDPGESTKGLRAPTGRPTGSPQSDPEPTPERLP